MGEFGNRGLIPLALVIFLSIFVLTGCTQLPFGPSGTTDTEDKYGPQLEALNSDIYQANNEVAAESARQKVTIIKDSMAGDPNYAKYLPLVDAQLATLGIIELNWQYVNEADYYAKNGVDCTKDYTALLSDMKNAQAKVNSAKAAVNAYLATAPNSTAKLLLKRINGTDATGMGNFAQFIERDYAKSCVKPQAPKSSYTLPLSKNDALSLVVSEVVGSNGYYVYTIGSPLKAGTTVTFPRDEGDYNLTLTKAAWFFLVDTQPLAPFDHPVKFVLVNVDDASYSVYNESAAPIINGVTYWGTSDERDNKNNIVYPKNANVDLRPSAGPYEFRYQFFSLAAAGSTIPVGTPVPFPDDFCCEEVGEKYALVITGYDEQMFRGDTAQMYNYLRGEDYTDANIIYLTTKATDPNSDGVTTLATVRDNFNTMIAKAKCCDNVFIYLAGHGSNVEFWQYKHKTTGATNWVTGVGALDGGVANWDATGRSGNFHKITINPAFRSNDSGVITDHGSPEGGRMFSYQLSDFIKKIKSCYKTVMYFSCYSGTAAPTLAGNGTTIITPTSTDRVAWGWTAGGSIFTGFFVQAKTNETASHEADSNGDGSVTDKEAFDWAKGKTSAWARAENQTQEGTYTAPVGKCRCCHVICEDSTKICKVIEGDGVDSVLCPKVGDYCGQMESTPNVTTHTECSHYECIVVEGEGEDQCMYDQDCEEPEEAICGDGKITAPEGCDYANTSTNKCPEGKYCTEKCECKQLETSVVCGDGKISSPNEDCDGGSVKTDICPQGQGCYICKCKTIEAVCGDGRITAPEQCDHGNTVTGRCQNTGDTCQNCQCKSPTQQATHKQCVENACVDVAGAGEDTCQTNDQCAPAIAPKHAECSNEKCIQVDGEGMDACTVDADCKAPAVCGNQKIESPEQCEQDSDCSSGKICSSCYCITKPTYCGDGIVNNNEQCDGTAGICDGGVCGSNCQCVYPPTLNCGSICAEMGSGFAVLGTGHGKADAQACLDAAREEPVTCQTTCIRSGFYRVDNIAGWDSCCCKKKQTFACSDCPGQNPQCPACPTEYQ
ncbi:MAG: hypothetical protein V1492_03920 [Candidatus Micrarchaeota archaeon]